MKKGICYIVGAGENYGLNFSPCADDFVIAADGGLKYLEESGIAADLVIGDFDTLSSPPEHENVILLKREKDDTDMLAAVREGLRAGYAEFHIYCGTGGRTEHTFANIQLLAFLSENGARGFLLGRDTVMTALKNGKMTFREKEDGYVSVFSLTEKSVGVNLRGLKYRLDDATVTNIFPIGVSNEFTGTKSSISVENGTLLIIFPCEAEEGIGYEA